ncbi:hypothetical protein FQN54_006569 [Arachnomyces sp. PD_36]|nr:hypothetical protein FQN54_006569 [Arachnomyces sp. PD_36]
MVLVTAPPSPPTGVMASLDLMPHGKEKQCHIPVSSTSHPDNPIPEEPRSVPRLEVSKPELFSAASDSHSSSLSSQPPSDTSSDPGTPATQDTEIQEDVGEQEKPVKQGQRHRRASTVLISQNSADVRKILGNGPETIPKVCCGGGCCMMQPLQEPGSSSTIHPIVKPTNSAFKSLNLSLGFLTLDSKLSNTAPLPEKTVSFSSLPADSTEKHISGPEDHPPKFLQPHPPYDVYRAPLHHARELTKPGAEKRTYHFDLDVTDYPAESGDVDFVVGGAIGVCPKNPDGLIEEIFDLLGVPKMVRDRKVLLKTTSGRWPTIWGDEKARTIVTTRRELLAWCSDLQSYPPTKPFFRLLAEYASDPNEKKILTFLASAQGQAAFCDIRTGPHISISQLLHAFPSSIPPLDHLLSTLNTLMPRFYSLSQDPQVEESAKGNGSKRLIEVAVTIHEGPDWKRGSRTGVGSGFLERIAHKLLDAEKAGIDPRTLDLHIPMFRGLMSNPLAREFVADGPMLLIGAGVGVAPFRGFVQRRLKSANCANKVWVLQGIRDSLLDELYSGEWGVEEEKVKKVVQSRKGESRYVQEEVRHQADLVWFVINALDGRVFVCGSSQGMGEGVEAALVDVAMAKGNLNREEAELFWLGKKEGGQYIAETW